MNNLNVASKIVDGFLAYIECNMPALCMVWDEYPPGAQRAIQDEWIMGIRSTLDRYSQSLSDRELAMVMAGLRNIQRLARHGGEFNLRYNDFATDAGRLEPLSIGEIDMLCRRLNEAT